MPLPGDDIRGHKNKVNLDGVLSMHSKYQTTHADSKSVDIVQTNDRRKKQTNRTNKTKKITYIYSIQRSYT